MTTTFIFQSILIYLFSLWMLASFLAPAISSQMLQTLTFMCLDVLVRSSNLTNMNQSPKIAKWKLCLNLKKRHWCVTILPADLWLRCRRDGFGFVSEHSQAPWMHFELRRELNRSVSWAHKFPGKSRKTFSNWKSEASCDILTWGCHPTVDEPVLRTQFRLSAVPGSFPRDWLGRWLWQHPEEHMTS